MAIDALDVISLEQLRQQVEYDYDDRDALITLYAQSALEYCLCYCDNPAWQKAEDIPAPVKSAILLTFADLFEHRTAQSEVTLTDNKAVERLLWPYRHWGNAS
ncbi:phage head-tail connector protein [Xenorhabdus sp. DI]|uniref:head-tail connector protein n=1 Tax=Xenorhabdus doucetiae TaxID=351671 RepID=UPI0019B9B2D4|nr:MULTISPECIES: head-tail connector protein [unclassified Xenorhabdus]MBD2785515.1 phage head-tail connector protein [Xenorhabdus sp. 3]MBD2789873.1 phage head-tail connector protein [Xenorhabdus sp. DI]